MLVEIAVAVLIIGILATLAVPIAKRAQQRARCNACLKKVLLGLTTIDEIEQNTSFEWAS